MSPVKGKFAAHWKLPVISVAVVGVGLAIALPTSMASSHRTASSITSGSIAGPAAQAKHNASGVIAHPAANPATGRLARPSTGCRVTYASTDWPGAFTVKVTIENRGTTSINGWKLTFAFPGDETISSAWNTTFTQTRAKVSATSTNYDTSIPPGASQSLGFQGTWTSDDTAPTSFSVNGVPCG